MLSVRISHCFRVVLLTPEDAAVSMSPDRDDDLLQERSVRIYDRIEKELT
jgi:hypothetical protein